MVGWNSDKDAKNLDEIILESSENELQLSHVIVGVKLIELNAPDNLISESDEKARSTFFVNTFK